MFFYDKLENQSFHLFCGKIQELGGMVIQGPPRKIDAWQPVKRGFGHVLKALSKAKQRDGWSMTN